MGSIQCHVLVGRDAELGALTASLEQVGHQGGLIFVTGEPGVGKSRIARELTAVATAGGFAVARGRAVEASSPVPLRPVVEALAGVARSSSVPDMPAMTGYLPALATLVPQWRTPAGSPAEISPLIVGEALLRLLAGLDGKRALLVLEDLQFADPETLAVVEYLADTIAAEPVLCVGTLRDTEPSPALDLVRSVHARRAAKVITLSRLPDADVAAMAAACLDTEDLDPRIAARLVADSDGLPFAIEEILASAVASGELLRGPGGWEANETVTTGVPSSIAETVRHRLAGLGTQGIDVVVAAAVLGRQFDWTLLPGIVGASEQEVFGTLRGAIAAQLIEPPRPGEVTLRFQHSLTRDAIVSGLLPPLLARHAARAACAVEAAHPDLPAGWCELAAELHETAGHYVRSAALLLEAGRRSLDRGALTSAAGSLRRAGNVLAKAESSEPAMRAEIDDALARVHMLAGDCEQLMPVAERLLDELDELGAPRSQAAELCMRVARALSHADRAELARQRVAQARALAAGTGNPSLNGWADAVAARCAIDAGDPDGALALARSGLASAEAAMPSDCAAEAACEALEVIGRAERVQDTAAATAAFERAFQISSAHGLVVRRIDAMHELGTIEMFEVAGSGRLAEARRLALECGAVSTATVLDLQLANALSLSSDLEGALHAAAQSQQAARRLRMRRVEAMAAAAQACIVATMGDREGTEAAADRALRLAPEDSSVLTMVWGDARATAAIVANELPRALAATQAGIGHGRQERLTAPSMAWGYWPLLTAVAGHGGRAELAEARNTGAEVACWNRGCLAYAEAVLLGRDGEPELASQRAEYAREQFATFAPWWNHFMHRLVAPAALKDGWGEPVAWLREAIGELDGAGFSRLASACRGILRQAGERVPRSGRGSAAVPHSLSRLGVTSREMDVFLLIGQGRSNAEIASLLVISPKTVETHVASLVAKIGLAGRRELVAFAARASRSGDQIPAPARPARPADRTNPAGLPDPDAALRLATTSSARP